MTRSFMCSLINNRPTPVSLKKRYGDFVAFAVKLMYNIGDVAEFEIFLKKCRISAFSIVLLLKVPFRPLRKKDGNDRRRT